MADEWRPSKRQHYWEQTEYREDSWRLVETCRHSNSREKHQLTLMWKPQKGNNNRRLHKNHERGLITAIRNDTDNTIDERMTTIRKQKWEEKQLYGHFKRLINNISHQNTWTWQRKGNLKTETESLLIVAQDNAIRTNHIKTRIDKTQQNSKCRLCGDRDETINHISECSKLAQEEYKARHWEMCRKFQFNHTNKWYMHNPAPVLENDSHKLL